MKKYSSLTAVSLYLQVFTKYFHNIEISDQFKRPKEEVGLFNSKSVSSGYNDLHI